MDTVRTQRLGPSYLIGAHAGITAVGIGMHVGLAISYLWESSNDSHITCILTGTAIGGLAGVVRTAVERYFGPQSNRLLRVALDVMTGGVPPLLFTVKCLAFPPFDWAGVPGLIYLANCSAIGGSSGVVFVPIAIAGAIASRIANAELEAIQAEI